MEEFKKKRNIFKLIFFLAIGLRITGRGWAEGRGSYEANAIIQERCRWLGARQQLRRWWMRWDPGYILTGNADKQDA